MENERRWVSFELGPVAGQGWLHSDIQQGAWSRENSVSTWHPYEAERWASKRLMTGLFNLMAQSEPPWSPSNEGDWYLPPEVRVRKGLLNSELAIYGGRGSAKSLWFDEMSDYTALGWDLASERSDWAVDYLVRFDAERRLWTPQEFRSMYLQEYTPPESSPPNRAGVGHTTDRKGDYNGIRRKWDRF